MVFHTALVLRSLYTTLTTSIVRRLSAAQILPTPAIRKYYSTAQSTTFGSLASTSQWSKSLEQNMIPQIIHTLEPKSLKHIENVLNSWLKPSLYAENWDNIGLLIGSGKYTKEDKMVSSILVCNDLTTAVTNEAIEMGAQLIVAYHPPIFSAIKRIGFSWKDSIISKCLAYDISVYSPHTMLDSVPGGINDSIIHMLSSLCQNQDDYLTESIMPNKSPLAPTIELSYKTQCVENNYPSILKLAQALVGFERNDTSFSVNLLNLKSTSEIELSLLHKDGTDDSVLFYALSSMDDIVSKLTPDAVLPSTGREITPPGAGRIIKFKSAKSILEIQKSLQENMGIQHFKVADTGKEILSVAVCAGSGGSLLTDVDADLVITGELSHHEVLHSFESGKSVILCGHANSERHYLPTLANILRILLNGPAIHVSKSDTNILQWV